MQMGMETMKNMKAFRKGDRVQLSKEGCELNPSAKYCNRKGTVAHQPQNEGQFHISVLWDGRSSIEYIHVTFIKHVEE